MTNISQLQDPEGEFDSDDDEKVMDRYSSILLGVILGYKVGDNADANKNYIYYSECRGGQTGGVKQGPKFERLMFLFNPFGLPGANVFVLALGYGQNVNAFRDSISMHDGEVFSEFIVFFNMIVKFHSFFDYFVSCVIYFYYLGPGRLVAIEFPPKVSKFLHLTDLPLLLIPNSLRPVGIPPALHIPVVPVNDQSLKQ